MRNTRQVAGIPTAFKLEEVVYLDRKAIQLDRLLLNLFELLRFDARPAVWPHARVWDLDDLVHLVRQKRERFPGFADQPEDIVRAWLSSDILEIMHRGKPGQETFVGPRPFHLNAFKLANRKKVEDYGGSKQVWAMLFHADRDLLTRLKEFFGRGVDPATDKYDGTTSLDLETLSVLGLVDQVTVGAQATPAPDPLRPICLGQGRIMADDLRRLLAYEGVVPRNVLAGYIRTVIGLHLSLFMLRLFRMLPEWCRERRIHPTCLECPSGIAGCGVGGCAYPFEIAVDLTGNPNSPSAALARASAAWHIEGIAAYVRAVIILHRVKDYVKVRPEYQAARASGLTITDLIGVLASPPQTFEGFFETRIGDLQGDDEEEDPVRQGILSMTNLSALEKYVEMVCLARMKNERGHVIKLLDALAQKNRPGGFLKQTAGRLAPRWFVLGNDLLETLVQIAVMDVTADGRPYQRPILIDEFLEWLRKRYSFVVYAPAHREVLPEEQEAWRVNERGLRERLRQIGFFTDLSDAYNSQTLRPRYKVVKHD